MEITWYGRACFRLKGKDATVITDPCPPATGFVAGKHDVDLLTISHDHPDHSYTRSISAGLEASTVTPGRMAPEASRTVPASEACADASAGKRSAHARSMAVLAGLYMTDFSFAGTSRVPAVVTTSAVTSYPERRKNTVAI